MPYKKLCRNQGGRPSPLRRIYRRPRRAHPREDLSQSSTSLWTTLSPAPLVPEATVYSSVDELVTN